MMRKLSKAALAVSRVLNEHIEGFIGEIGFDLGVDNSGKFGCLKPIPAPGAAFFPSEAEIGRLPDKTEKF